MVNIIFKKQVYSGCNGQFIGLCSETFVKDKIINMFLDFSKASERVNLKLLITKCEKLGIRGLP